MYLWKWYKEWLMKWWIEMNVRNSEGKMGWKCNIWVTKHSPPAELVACPDAIVHKLFLTLALHDNVFNNKSFHDVKYMSSNLFYLWLVLVWQPWQMLVLVLTTFISFTCFLMVGSCVTTMKMTNVGSYVNNIHSFLWLQYIIFESVHTSEMISHRCKFSSCL